MSNKYFYGYKTNIKMRDGSELSLFSKEKPIEDDEELTIDSKVLRYEVMAGYDVTLEYVCDDPLCTDPDCVRARKERKGKPVKLPSCSGCSK